MRSSTIILILLMAFICNIVLVSSQTSEPSSSYANRSLMEVARNGLTPQTKLISSPQKVEVNATGNFQFSLPLMTIPGPGGLNYDLKLSYTPGVKVTDEASWVGLGWNLDVGCIRRDVQGSMDATINKKNYLDDNLYSQPDDYIRDIYSISSPAGNGKALQYLNDDGITYNFALEDWKAWQIIYDQSYHRFIVVIEDGTKYIFGLAAPGLACRALGDPINGDLHNGLPQEEPFTQWFLTAILGPDYVDGGGDEYNPLDGTMPNKGNWIAIKWKYDDHNGAERTFKKFYYKAWTDLGQYGTDISLTSVTYPSFIITPTFVAKFETEDEMRNPISELLDTKWTEADKDSWMDSNNKYLGQDDDDTDFGQVKKRLKSIKLYRNYDGKCFTTIPATQQILQEVDFKYQEPDPNLNWDGRIQPKPMETINPDGTKIDGYREFRTLLRGITTIAGDVTFPDYRFDYYDIIGNTNPFWYNGWLSVGGVYGLRYYAGPFLDPDKCRVGFLGWYNSKSGSLTNDYTYLNQCYYANGNLSDGVMWNLKKVTYPSGGSITFDYESNVYLMDFTYMGSTSAIQVCGAGSRLKSQTLYGGDNTSVSGTYVYNYGTVTSDSDPTIVSGVGRMYADPIEYYATFQKFVLPNGSLLTRTFYPPENSWFFHQTNHQVLYQQVTEQQPDGSIIKSYYGTAYLKENISPNLGDLDTQGNLTAQGIFNETKSRKGLLIKREYYGSDEQLKPEITPRKTEEFNLAENLSHYAVSVWPIFSTQKESYTISSTVDGVESLIATYYSSQDGMPSLIEETNSDNTTTRRTRLFYPSDFAIFNNTIINSLIDRNILNPVLEKFISDGTQIQSATLSIYNQDTPNLMPRLFKVFNLCSTEPILEPISDNDILNAEQYYIQNSFDDNYLMTQSFDIYDDYGHPLQSTDANGIITKSIFNSSNGTRLADFKNTGIENVNADNFDDGSITDNDPFSGTISGDGKWSIVNGVLTSSNNSTSSAYAGNHTADYQNFTADVTLHIINDHGESGNWAGIHFGSEAIDVSGTGYLVYYQNNGSINLYKEKVNLISVQTCLLPNVGRRLSVTVNGTNVQVFIDGQRFINYNLETPATAGYISLVAYGIDAEFDDFRSYPVGALAKSYGYDPIFLHVTRMTDENGISINYEYDACRRLHRILDQQKNPLQEIDYSPDLRSVSKTYFQHANIVKNPSFEDQVQVLRADPANNQLFPKNWILETGPDKGQLNFNDSLCVQFSNDGPIGSNAVLLTSNSVHPNYRIVQNLGKLKTGKSYILSWSQHGYGSIVLYYSTVSSETQLILGSGLDYEYINHAQFTVDRDADVYIAIQSGGTNYEVDFVEVREAIGDNESCTLSSGILNNERLPGFTQTKMDGFGREIQALTQLSLSNPGNAPHGWIGIDKEYDASGRLTLVGIPDVSESFPSGAICNNSNETDYYPDPLDRVLYQSGSWDINRNHSVQYSYYCNDDQTLFETQRMDENGNTVDTYKDSFGNIIKTVVDAAGLNLTTSFGYDIMGHLLYSIDPEDPYSKSSCYDYNTLGQLTDKLTTDAGWVYYLYDKNGNLRFTKDAVHNFELFLCDVHPGKGNRQDGKNISLNMKTSGNSKTPMAKSIIPSGSNKAAQTHGAKKLRGKNKTLDYSNMTIINWPDGPLSISGSSNNSYLDDGYFTMFRPGMVTIIFTAATAKSNNAFVRIMASNGTIIFTCPNSPYSGLPYITHFYLPRGDYMIECESQVEVQTSYAISCNKYFDLVYNKYDSFNRVIETGEVASEKNDDYFTDDYAKVADFPSTGYDYMIAKKFIYDIPADDPLAANQRNIRGKLSTAISYRFGNVALITYYSYDERDRVEWIIEKGLGSSPKKIEYAYDMQGNVLKKGIVELLNKNYNHYTSYSYYQNGRLKEVDVSQLGSSSTNILAGNYSYTPTGKALQQHLCPSNNVVIDYSYNERDWLTGIRANQGSIFEMNLGYDKINGIGVAQSAEPQFNGNISWCDFKNNIIDNNQVGYTYFYDGANRLIQADFGINQNGWTDTKSYDIDEITYSGNGNINTVKAYGQDPSKLMDDLTYYYPKYFLPGTNRLRFIKDAAPPNDYPDDVENQSGDPSNWDYDNYLYDDNGNMIQDLMSDIGFEIYDINNQPVAIYKKSDGTCYQYAYDTQGHRIMKRVSKPEYYLNGADGKTEEIVYNNILKVQYNIYGNDMIGFVQRNQSQVQRYYYIKDYLGSNRVVIDENRNIKSAEDFGPFGNVLEGRSVNYGLANNDYKFVGMERDVETGCDNNDDRIYDSRVFRSRSVDPYASKDPSRSPYSYAGNNPINFIDMKGDSAWSITNQWNDQFIKKYQSFVSEYISQFKDKTDCADLALSALVEFASQNNLPVNLTYYDNDSKEVKSFNAASDEFSNKNEYLETVKTNLGALNIIDNSKPIKLSEAGGGDLLMSKLSPTMGHTRVIYENVFDKTSNDYWIVWYKGTLPPTVPVRQEGPFKKIPNIFGNSPRRWRFDLWH